IACLGADERGNVYNINADIVGNQLAAALHADRLFLVTSAPGVLRDVKDPASRLPQLTVADARQAIADGIVTGGMIPKLEEAIADVVPAWTTAATGATRSRHLQPRESTNRGTAGSSHTRSHATRIWWAQPVRAHGGAEAGAEDGADRGGAGYVGCARSPRGAR